MNSIEQIRSKIQGRNELSAILHDYRNAGKKIIFTNGCFDILHRGHIEYLTAAADLGDVFIIGLNSDESVRGLKGENRPAVDEGSRALIMASFEFVDHVVIFPEETPCDLLEILQPDIWVKGGDYKNIEDLPEYGIVTSYGGEAIVLPFIEGYSTTEIFNRILGILKDGQNKN
jgi:rfaE bifunctional protein nucleotidyltransferase chain/domain